MENNEGVDVCFYEVFRADAMEWLETWRIPWEEKNQLQHDKKEVEECLQRLKNEKKSIEQDIKKRAAFFKAKKSFKDLREKKSKLDRPIRAEIMSILDEFKISPAAYHEGDLNGVSACCLMDSVVIFPEIQQYSLSYEHDKRYSEEIIGKHCTIYGSIYSTLDDITSKLCIKSGEASSEGYMYGRSFKHSKGSME